MRVDWLVPCRYAEQAGDGTLAMVGAGMDIFFVPEENLPATLSLFLGTRLCGTEDELADEQRHTFAFKLLRPADIEEEDLLSIEFGLGELPALRLPGHEVGIVLPIIVQWEAQSYGEHGFQVFLDGERERNPVNISVRIPAEPGEDSGDAEPDDESED